MGLSQDIPAGITKATGRSSDMHRLVAEFGMEHGAGDADRIHGSH